MRIPAGSSGGPTSRTGENEDHGSRVSPPAISEKRSAASPTERVSGPTVSIEGASGKTPEIGMRPCVTFNPITPHSAAGTRTDPPVSVPSAAAARSAATAAPDPPEDPPGDVSGFHGLRTGPNQWFSLENPKANSCRPVLPTATAPARSRRSTAGAVRSGITR